jgi:hypothetical protein
MLARVNNAVVDFLRRDRSLETLGADAIYPTIREAVAAAQSGHTQRGKARLRDDQRDAEQGAVGRQPPSTRSSDEHHVR